jgi:hypothetical protein
MKMKEESFPQSLAFLICIDWKEKQRELQRH